MRLTEIPASELIVCGPVYVMQSPSGCRLTVDIVGESEIPGRLAVKVLTADDGGYSGFTRHVRPADYRWFLATGR